MVGVRMDSSSQSKGGLVALFIAYASVIIHWGGVRVVTPSSLLPYFRFSTFRRGFLIPSLNGGVRPRSGLKRG